MSPEDNSPAPDPNLAFDRLVALAPEGFVADLVAELGEVEAVHDRLVIAPPRAADAALPAWAQNVWLDPVIIPIASIGEAASRLREIQRNWAGYAFQLHRRTALIQDRLPKIAGRPISFPSPVPASPMGAFCLLDANTMLVSPHCSSPWPHGEVSFAEDRESSPSRAYLKLWETFTRLGIQPGPGEVCLDLGACPGGWSWVLAQNGASVIAVDKAPLDPRIAALPNIKFLQQSAFALDPAEIGPVDWWCSDIICYPARLLRMVEIWRASGLVKNFVCTLKFQGETDHETARAFAAIPGSRLFHLHHNKHELTWVLAAAKP